MEIKKGFVLINLLPYRDKIKKNKIKQLGLLLGFFALTGLALIFFAHTFISVQIDAQKERNEFIVKTNKDLDSKITEIATLKDQIKETLEKRNVVEKLQVNRSDSVNILNEIANAIPDGVAIKDVKKVGEKITIVGFTQSNAKVSNYMTALDETTIFEKPELIEVKLVGMKESSNKKNAEEVKINEFTIAVSMERKKEEVKKDKNSKKADAIKEDKK